MRKLWLIFAQTITVCVAIVFTVSTLRPDWMPHRWLGTPTPSFQQAPAEKRRVEPPSSFAQATKKAAPAVVNIFTRKQAPRSVPQRNDPFFRFFFGDQPPQHNQQPQDESSSLGSGVIVSTQGYVLTNNHVIEEASAIEVALADGRTANAQVVGTDPETDLAVLKINLDNLPVVTFGEVNNLLVGDVVLAIGNPFGVGQTTTMGIVSALGRNHLGINTFENFIQTDAAINPGNSGGALIDANGNLIGINTAIYSRTGGSLGIGFAIPVSTAKQVMEQLIQNGSVTRGFIGIETQSITPEIAQHFKLAKESGAYVTGVVEGGPADRAGIRTGDIVLSINDTAITKSEDLLNTVTRFQPGNKIEMRILRNNQTLKVQLTIAQRPTPRRQQ